MPITNTNFHAPLILTQLARAKIKGVSLRTKSPQMVILGAPKIWGSLVFFADS